MIRNALALLVLSVLAGGVASAADDEYVYSPKTGKLTRNGTVVATGYSGHGEGVNNPDKEKVKNVGPIPAGTWTIGAAFKHDSKGPTVMRLMPTGHDAHGRSGFLIHGDNSKNDRSASEGCVILGKTVREEIAKSGVTKLRVVKE